MMTIVLHFATALSTLVIYRREVGTIIAGLLQCKNNEQLQFSIKIIISMIPAAAIGVLFADELERLFDRQILLVGAMLWITGLLLFVADRAQNTGRCRSSGRAERIVNRGAPRGVPTGGNGQFSVIPDQNQKDFGINT